MKTSQLLTLAALLTSVTSACATNNLSDEIKDSSHQFTSTLVPTQRDLTNQEAVELYLLEQEIPAHVVNILAQPNATDRVIRLSLYKQLGLNKENVEKNMDFLNEARDKANKK